MTYEVEYCHERRHLGQWQQSSLMTPEPLDFLHQSFVGCLEVLVGCHDFVNKNEEFVDLMQHVIDGVDPLRIVVLKWHCNHSYSTGVSVLDGQNTD